MNPLFFTIGPSGRLWPRRRTPIEGPSARGSLVGRSPQWLRNGHDHLTIIDAINAGGSMADTTGGDWEPESPRPAAQPAQTNWFKRAAMAVVSSFARLGRWAWHNKLASTATGTFVVVLGLFGYAFFTEDVFIDDVNIAPTLQGRGFDSAGLINQAMFNIPLAVHARVSAVSEPENRFLEPVERKSLSFEHERVCNLSLPTTKTDFGIYLGGMRKAAMSSSVDEIVLKNAFSIRKAAFFVRERLGYQARELRPSIYIGGDGKYEISIASIPVVGPPLTKSFSDLREKDRVFAELLVDHLSPEVRVLELLNEGATDFASPESIARDFLRDRQRTLRIAATTASRDLERSRQYASLRHHYIKHERLNRQLLAELDFSVYGRDAAVARFALALRVAEAEEGKARNERKPVLKDKIFEEHVRPYADKLETTPRGQLALIERYIEMGRFDEYRRHLNELLDSRFDAKSQVPSKYDVLIFTLNELIGRKAVDEAKAILASDRLRQVSFSGPGHQLAIQATQAALDAAKGNLEPYRKLASAGLDKYPCIEMLLVTQIYHLADDIDFWTNTGRLDLMMESFRRMERSGLKGYDFYQMWADIASEGARHEGTTKRFSEEAIKQYRASLRYDGEHTWSHLNAGAVLGRLGRFEEARAAFEASLKIGKVPNAVWGLLVTLRNLEQSRAFLEAFNEYWQTLRFYDTDERRMLENHATVCACQLDVNLDRTIMHEEDGPFVVDGKPMIFDKDSCAFVEKR